MKKISLRFTALLTLGVLGSIGFCGCSTVPITGRQQLNLISAGQEMQLGLSSFENMKKEVPISRDAAANALVQRIGRRIANVAVNDLPGAQWEFIVFESKEANAFCLPGGKIGVYTGILPITKDEAGLATVLGHEVAHAAAHHGAERMSEALVTDLGGQILGLSLAKSDPKMQAAMSAIYGLGSQLGVALPHSRQNESEADEMGLIYMARAGFNPAAAVALWERFASATGSNGGGLWFLRTHPVTGDRIQHIKSILPRAEVEFKNAPR